MKSFATSLMVTAVLATGFFIATRPGGTEPDGRLATSAVVRLEERIRAMEERLGELARLEREVKWLASLAVEGEGGTDEGRGQDDHGEAGSADSGKGARTRAESEALREASELLAVRGQDGLGDYVRGVIAAERRERRIAEQRRAEERRRELEALHEGPYGEHNYRVNSLAQRLDLSDRQKQSLYVNLLHYNEQIQASRRLEEGDGDNRDAYREQRKQLREEFRQVVLGTLTPEQAEVYSSLPEDQQRPDGPQGAGLFYHTTIFRGYGPEGPVNIDIGPEGASEDDERAPPPTPAETVLQKREDENQVKER